MKELHIDWTRAAAYTKDAAQRFTETAQRVRESAAGQTLSLTHRIAVRGADIAIKLREWFRAPGWSEIAALTAFAGAILGGISAIFSRRARKLLPLFGMLAAIGTGIMVLRCLFPRRED